MALSYKSRRRWSVVILLVGLPLYIILAVNLVALFGRQSILVELVIYVVLGIVWILPFKSIFRGIGQADPDATPDATPDDKPKS
jgi:uncharacterized membrane protein YuzA (DUF378 family)